MTIATLILLGHLDRRSGHLVRIYIVLGGTRSSAMHNLEQTLKPLLV